MHQYIVVIRRPGKRDRYLMPGMSPALPEWTADRALAQKFSTKSGAEEAIRVDRNALMMIQRTTDGVEWAVETACGQTW